MRKPDFIIAGAAKSGTTSIAQYLDEHPAIYVRAAHSETVPEPHYFGSDLPLRDDVPFRKGRPSLEEYQSFFNDRTEECIGEKSVFYLYSERAAAEIHKHNPDTKIIIMLRNPVDMIYSLYSEMHFRYEEDIESFADALAAEPDRAKGLRIPETCKFTTVLQYRAVGRFAAQVQRFHDTFPNEQLFVALMDDLVADTPGLYRSMLEFLEVDPGYQADFSVRNPNTRSRFGGLMQLALAPPKPIRPIAQAVSKIPGVYSGLSRLFWALRVEEKRDALDPALRRTLQEEFRDDVLRLGDLLGRDLGHWCEQS